MIARLPVRPGPDGLDELVLPRCPPSCRGLVDHVVHRLRERGHEPSPTLALVLVRREEEYTKRRRDDDGA